LQPDFVGTFFDLAFQQRGNHTSILLLGQGSPLAQTTYVLSREPAW